jgi:hypothetical protein
MRAGSNACASAANSRHKALPDQTKIATSDQHAGAPLNGRRRACEGATLKREPGVLSEERRAGNQPGHNPRVTKRVNQVNSVQKSSAPVNAAGERELLIHSLRLATARARLIVNSLETVGVSLRHRAIDTDSAMKWLSEEGLLDWIEFGPSKTGGAQQ